MRSPINRRHTKMSLPPRHQAVGAVKHAFPLRWRLGLECEPDGDLLLEGKMHCNPPWFSLVAIVLLSGVMQCVMKSALNELSCFIPQG